MDFCRVGRRLDQRSSSEERCPSARKTSAILSVAALTIIGFWCYYKYYLPGTILFWCFLFSMCCLFLLGLIRFFYLSAYFFFVRTWYTTGTFDGVNLWLRKSHLSPLTRTTRRFCCQDKNNNSMVACEHVETWADLAVLRAPSLQRKAHGAPLCWRKFSIHCTIILPPQLTNVASSRISRSMLSIQPTTCLPK